MNYVRAMMPMHARYLTGQRLSLVIDINKTILMTDPAVSQYKLLIILEIINSLEFHGGMTRNRNE